MSYSTLYLKTLSKSNYKYSNLLTSSHRIRRRTLYDKSRES